MLLLLFFIIDKTHTENCHREAGQCDSIGAAGHEQRRSGWRQAETETRGARQQFRWSAENAQARKSGKFPEAEVLVTNSRSLWLTLYSIILGQLPLSE